MTRFARAKGSKSSNERVPEQATSWSEMRRDLHRESVRKAAEEQIARESHHEQHHNLEKTAPDTSTTKAKVKEPLELAPFDVQPQLSTRSVQAPEYPKISVTKMALKKVNNHGSIQKEMLFSSKEAFVNRKSEQSPLKTQRVESRLLCTPDESLPFQSGEPKFSSKEAFVNRKSEQSPLKTQINKSRLLCTTDESLPFQSREQEFSSKEAFVNRKSEQSPLKTQINKSRLLCRTDESLPSQSPEPVLFEGLWSNKGSSEEMKVKSGISKPNVPAANKRKFQKEPKTSREGKNEDSEPQIGGNFKGYPVPVEDAETLTDAYNILRKEGLTHKQAMDKIKPERRRAEKRLARLKNTICFRCRKPGHRLSDCPMGGIDCAVCFKCGSTTHRYQDCKKKGSFVNAKCFICGVVGHLSAQCPENSNGVYPEGGECNICGEKSHLVKDCPQNRNKNEHHPGTTEFDDYFDEKPSASEAVEPKKKKIKKVQF